MRISFEGWSLPPHLALTADCEMFLLEHFSQKDIEKDRTFINKRWFDYRLHHPATMTDHFAHCYRKVFNYFVQTRFDDRERPNGINADLARVRKAERTGLFRARMHADQLGAPYMIYLHAAFKATEQRLWKALPRPHQLYSEFILEAVEARWLEIQRSQSVIPASATYRADFYTELPHQDAYRAWIAGCIEHCSARDIVLNSLVNDDHIFTQQEAQNLYGLHQVAPLQLSA